MRDLIDRHFNIEDPSGVTHAKDIEITRDDGGVQMHVAYDDTVPYVANVSLSRALRKDREGAVIPLRKPDDLAVWVERLIRPCVYDSRRSATRRSRIAAPARITTSAWNSWAMRFSIAAVARLLYDAHPQADEGASVALARLLGQRREPGADCRGAGFGRILCVWAPAN